VANIDQGFSVDILSLSDNTLVTSSTFDPRAIGFEAPEGSLFAYKHVTNSALLLKTGALNTDWTALSGGITSHPALTDRNLADQHAISAVTGLQLALNSKSDIAHAHILNDLTDVVTTTPVAGQTLSFDGTNWVNIGSASGIGGAAKRIWSGNILAAVGTTKINPGNTPPLITEGAELWNTTVTPWSANATYVIQSSIMLAASKRKANLTLAVFSTVGGVDTYLGGTVQIAASGKNSATLSCSLTHAPATTGPVTFSIRVGTTKGTWYVNRKSNGVTYGGTNTGWVLWEY